MATESTLENPHRDAKFVRAIRNFIRDASPAAAGIAWICGIGVVFFTSLKGFFTAISEMERPKGIGNND